MNRKKRIVNIITSNFKGWQVNVIDNSIEHSGHGDFDGSQESHFLVSLKADIKIFEKKLEIHRKINHLLSEEFKKGLHALEIKIII